MKEQEIPESFAQITVTWQYLSSRKLQQHSDDTSYADYELFSEPQN